MNVNLSSDIAQATRKVAAWGKQLPFATALALTTTASQLAKDVLPAALDKDLDRPTPFTKRGFFSKSANKRDLVAVVGVRDKQAEYLVYQIKGGTRKPRNKGIMIGSVKQSRNEYGNIPRAVFKLAQRAMSDRNTSGNVGRFFVGKPKGHNMPAGIYARVNNNTAIEPLFIFAKDAAYKKRFDMTSVAQLHITRTFEKNFRQAWQRATPG